MTRACWTAATDGSYWFDIALGTLPCRLMLDTGLTDTTGQVAFYIGPAMFDLLERSGQLLAAGSRPRRDSSGRRVRLPAGFIVAQLIEPTTGARIGPPVRCLAVRNFARVPSRVGVVFFHQLRGCRVEWELDARQWCVECP
jgi:hypothetical protein